MSTQTDAKPGDSKPDENPNRTPPVVPPPNNNLGQTTPIMDAENAADEDPLALYLVMIQRDAHTRVPMQVPGYEVPVLIEIWGEDNVFIVDQDEGQDPADFDAERAYDALRTKYGKHGDKVREVYPSLHRFARVVGVKASTSGTATSREKRSLQKVRKPAAKKAAAKR